MLFKLIKNYILFAIIIFFSANSAFADRNLRGIEIIKSNDNELILDYEVPYKSMIKITLDDGEVTHYPNIIGSFPSSGNPGSPLEFQISENIVVPNESAFKIIDYQVEEYIIESYTMTPSPELFSKDEMPVAKYVMGDYSTYLPDSEIVKLNYSGIARDKHIAQLSILSAYYSPSNKKIIIPSKIRIKIQFFPHQSELKSSKSTSHISAINKNTCNFTIPDFKALKVEVKKKKSEIQNSSSRVKIKVSEQGIYKITSDQLSSLGFSFTAEEVKTIKIFGRGGKELSEYIPEAVNNEMNEQEIIVNTKSNGTLDHILFYGAPTHGWQQDNLSKVSHYINHYSEDNYYILSWGGEYGKRANEKTVPSQSADIIPEKYIHRDFFEEELYNVYTAGSGRTWLGRSVFPSNLDIKIHDASLADSINVKLSLAHMSDYNGQFTIKDNYNNLLFDLYMGSIYTSSYYEARIRRGDVDFPISNIKNNILSLNLSYTNPQLSKSSAWFDYYEIAYPRPLKAIDNELYMTYQVEDKSIYQIETNGFSGSTIAFDVSDPANPVLLKNNSSSSNFTIKTELDSNQFAQFYVSGKTKSAELSTIKFVDLRSIEEECDMIIITNQNLLQSAEAFAEYREKQSGIKSSIFLVSDIFNEFADGMPDPTAIRDFIAHIMNKKEEKPKYAFIWGDGHYDYRNLSTNEKNQVITYQTLTTTETFRATNTFTTDDYYTKVIGDDEIWDLPISRLTISDNQEGFDYINKLDAYENSSSDDLWRSRITLVGDDSWSGQKGDRPRLDGSVYIEASETLAMYYLPEKFQLKKIYLPEFQSHKLPGGHVRKPSVNEELLSAINLDGSIILNWIGHGNPRLWAHEQILERSLTIPQLSNIDKQFFLVAATCDFGRFDMIETKSGAEELVHSEKGGAVGVFSASRVVFQDGNERISQLFYECLFKTDEETGEYPSLGDVIFQVKQERVSDNDQKFFLLADPSLKLKIPDQKISFDKINNTDLSSLEDTLQLKGLQKIKIECSIRDAQNSVIDDFNGNAIITMLDGDEIIGIKDEYNQGTVYYINKLGGALNKSSYKVNNGKFQAEFIIPKDISFSTGLGRLYSYALSDDDRYAMGNFGKFMINDIDATGIVDQMGPEIDIFIDSRRFKQGMVVSSSPLLMVDLYDESGINTTGNGFGHKIEAWIDDNPESIDLTQGYKSSSDNPLKGTAEEILYSLEPGLHKIKVRAWDVFNNFSIAETYFNINSEGQVDIYNIGNYPNPFSENTVITFNHNMTPPLNIDLEILDISGKLVRKLQGVSSSRFSSEISWDGKDESGNSPAQGTYIVNLKIKSFDGFTTNKSGKIMLVKD